MLAHIHKEKNGIIKSWRSNFNAKPKLKQKRVKKNYE